MVHTSKVLVFILLSILCISANYLSPVILVPGDGGSQIDAKWDKDVSPHYLCSKSQETWYNLWLNLYELAPELIDCWIDNIKLHYDVKSRSSNNRVGVETRVKGFGSSSSVEYLDPSHFYFTSYFHTIVEAILPLGYKRDVTIKGAPFDFRRAPNELSDYMLSLRVLVQDTYAETGQKITLVSHSMGGPVIQNFMETVSQTWKDKYIQGLVSLSAPWVGAVKALKVFAAGYNLGHFFFNAFKLREVQRSNPSLAYLLPSSKEWNTTEILAETPNKNYSLSNIKEYFEDIKYPVGYFMHEDTKDLLVKSPAPAIEVHCLYGVGLPTTEKIKYESMKSFPDSPILVPGDGDGTVNRRSGSYCLKWKDEQTQKVYNVPLVGVDHMAMLDDIKVTSYLIKYLKETSETNYRNSIEDNSIHQFY